MGDHRHLLHELRRERVGTRDSHREIVKQARSELDRVRSEHRRTLNGRTVYWGPHKEDANLHREALTASQKTARSGLEAHRRALAENPWILMLADMAIKLENARKERERLRAERRERKELERAAVQASRVAARSIAPAPEGQQSGPARGAEESAAM